MTRNLTALLLAGALLCSLCACGPGSQAGEGSSSGLLPGSSSVPPEPLPDHSGEGEAAAGDLATEESPQTPPDTLEWEEDHRLDTDVRPENHGGLELPVRGATGYASVELGLWEIRPDQMPKPEPEPEPEPIADPEPVPEPDPSGTGAGDTSTQPAEGENAQAAQEGQTGGGEAETPQTEPASGQEEPTSSEGPEQSTPDSGDADQGSPAAAPAAAASSSSEVQLQSEPAQPEAEPDPFAGAAAVLAPGTPFTILEEQKDWWRIRCQQGTGWVEHRYCLINLPDVIPSMVYHATNSFSSLYRTSGKEIPGITGAAFYSGKSYNERLGREEYKMPVLYSMALKIAQAQWAALEEGNTLVLYEGYRPYSTQKAVRDAVSRMAEQDPEVKAGVSDPPWSQTWFISNGYSNHQKGFAIDVSLGKVWETEVKQCGSYTYLQVTDYSLYEMPTKMHELSLAAATFTAPVSVNSATAWKSAQLAAGMNEPALGLQRYCTEAGLTPLSSEWWHFNDLETRSQVLDRSGTGGFEIKACLSTVP